MRSLTDILKEADKATELSDLSRLWEEIVKNKYRFSLVQLQYAKEHLGRLAGDMGKKDATMLRPLFNQIFK